MAFVEMYKNGKTAKVPSSTIKMMEQSGWSVNYSDVTEDIPEVQIENTISDNEEFSDEDWDTIEDEVEKPISQMNNAELKEYAQHKGIDISGLSSNKQIREAIAKA